MQFLEKCSPKSLMKGFLYGSNSTLPAVKHTPEWESIQATRRQYQELNGNSTAIPTITDIPLIPGVPVTFSAPTEELPDNEPTESGGYLFKGIQPSAFAIYFRNGGITPSRTDKNWPWITESWERAYDHTGSSAMEKYRTCLAVIDKDILKRKKLKSDRDFTTLLAGNYYDYYGDETVSWEELIKVFVTARVGNEIYHFHNQTPNPTISWSEFAPRISLIEPGNLNDLKTKLTPFVRK